MEPEVAATLLSNNCGDQLFIKLSDAAKYLGVDPNFFLPWLRSGVLKAAGKKRSDGSFEDLHIQADGLIIVMAEAGLPKND